MKGFYKMGRVVVVTFDENEEEKLNELLHFLSAKKYSEMPGKQNRVLDYGALKINAEYITLSKDRYVIPYVDELKIEVDVFKEVYEGVVFAEIEFKSKEQAAQIELPKWFDKEMSQIITNSKMATQNMKSFIEFEK